MLVFSLAGAPYSVSQDATRAVNLLYCRLPRRYEDVFVEFSTHVDPQFLSVKQCCIHFFFENRLFHFVFIQGAAYFQHSTCTAR